MLKRNFSVAGATKATSATGTSPCFTRLALGLALVVGLGACGQRGPLILPAQTAAASSAAAAGQKAWLDSKAPAPPPATSPTALPARNP